MSEKIIEPTPENRSYNEGWKAYFSKSGVNTNPYCPDNETSLYESFIDGWSTAQLSNRTEGTEE